MKPMKEIKMDEHPILFQGEMIRAILADLKNQTRRVIKPQPLPDDPEKRQTRYYKGTAATWGRGATIKSQVKCPYGIPGDRLWVRETWRQRKEDGVIYYEADGAIGFDINSYAHKMNIGAVPCDGPLDEQAI
ncbi:unnamed protein product, partial [marine sediment metagenome]